MRHTAAFEGGAIQLGMLPGSDGATFTTPMQYVENNSNLVRHLDSAGNKALTLDHGPAVGSTAIRARVRNGAVSFTDNLFKVGANGTGPGGVGRAVYVDDPPFTIDALLPYLWNRSDAYTEGEDDDIGYAVAIEDLSGSTNHWALLTTHGAEITTNDTYPVLRGDGVATTGTVGALAVNQSALPCTICAVCSLNVTPDATSRTLYQQATGILILDGANGTTHWGLSFSGGYADSGQELVPDELTILTAVIRAANDIDFYTNGGNKVTVATGSAFYGTTVTLLFAGGTASVPAGGAESDLAELVCAPSALTTEQLGDLHADLAARWGITLAGS